MKLEPYQTLWEVRDQIVRTREFDDVLGLTVNPYGLTVRFVWKNLKDVDLPDELKYGDFLKLRQVDVAMIVITDGGGGGELVI